MMKQQNINESSMLRVGTVLRGIYRIDKYLSSGGFGNTYIATNTEFDEQVAIKEFFKRELNHRVDNQTTVGISHATDEPLFEELLAKFKKEAKRIRQLQNDHIVGVHDLFEENGTAYYVMDYIDGESLEERMVRTGKPLTEQEVRNILSQVLDALKVVHKAGLWHLDLKPANIMIDKSGNIKLIDFGSSKQLDAQRGGATALTRQTYTNGYAPREQMEENFSKYGPWTDIYALGGTLYALLTNTHPPLPSDIDDDDSIDKHKAFQFPTNVSKEMRDLILWMMNTNRSKRPQSIDDIQLGASSQPHSQNTQNNADSEDTIFTSNPNDKETIFASSNSFIRNDNEETILSQGGQDSNEQQTTTNDIETNNDGESSAKIVAIGFITIFVLACLFYIFGNNAGKETIEPELEDSDSIEEVIKNVETTPTYEDYDVDTAVSVDDYESEVLNEHYTKSLQSESNKQEKDYGLACKKILTEYDIQDFSKNDLKILRNWIFARHGYIFKTPDMRNFFENQPWYRGYYDDVTDLLTDLELKNIEFIKRYE